MEKLSIIIPAHNEEKRIGKTLIEYGKFFKNLKKQGILDFEIIVVLNACTDNTLNITKKVKMSVKEIKIFNFGPGGKGFAIIRGFKDALKRKNDLIGFVDADMATKPEAYYDLIKSINNYDGAIASRYIKGAVVKPKQTIQRIIASRIYNLFIRVILGFAYRDTQCGAKIFKNNTIKKILPSLRMSKWAFDADLLYAAKKLRLRIKETPTVWRDMEYSKINFMKSGPWMVLAIIRLRLLNSFLRRSVRIYDRVTEKIWKWSNKNA